jgi:glycosyltransferase involved in cell wall biosynthesis
MRILWTGTSAPDFSRNRKLARLLELLDAEVDVRRVRLWDDDRIGAATAGKARAALRMVTVYPRLAWSLLRAPTPDAYLVSYPGWFDVPLVALVARLRRRPVLFDPFISLYDTIVSDRKMFADGSVIARLARSTDRWSLRLADLVLADTQPHLDFFDELAGGHTRAGGVLPLGADDAVFAPRPDAAPRSDLVVFHGTFVPLQGLGTIAEAAAAVGSRGVRVRIIGDGQDRDLLLGRLRERGASGVDWVGLVPLDAVPEEIAVATVCLGVFGASDKAGRVVPNKVYECLAVGRPVITRQSPAIESMFGEGELVTVPPGDPDALAAAILDLVGDTDRRATVAEAGRRAYRERFHEGVLARRLGEHLDRLVATAGARRRRARSGPAR